ncbi:tannase and feruloyl esterase [Coniochaeta ligniaria NRRL 30616]|uniref:Carboxylic ester hydrolase n=1 Tax=Coniochaeta ligniaria NRRL 30616 TaxID=1408157 RepID=A0A1J7J7N2_9PEZI|nr:tannase and feruloyl esterase [Coniochaeta ligniaria NRRL 30616]
MRFVSLLGLFAATINAAAVTRPCSNIPAPHLPGARILSVSSTELRNHSVQAAPPLLNKNITNLNICEVVVTLTHPGANDTVTVQVWLPLDGAWTGRFASAGGSGWAAGHGPLTLAPLVADGYAAASTDAGLTGDIITPAAWALKPDGTVNLDLLTNFASRSVHDMAVVGKAVTASFYGRPARYSYWTGCSTGGRQGMAAAQKYPGDFDGILAGAPAIYWTEYVVAELWPQVVMKEAGYFPSACEFAAVRDDVVAVCDELDGVKDGVVSNLARCRYDPSRLVGKTITCEGEDDVTFTTTTASIVRKIWDGPKTPSGSSIWYGLPIDAPFASLAATVLVGNTTTTRTGAPFFVADTWSRYFVKANPAFDPSTLTRPTLHSLFAESVSKFSTLIDSSSPDLAPFQKAGGKLLVWHGTSDPLIFPQDTVRYRRAVEAATRADANVDDFFRVFLAPGTDHCGQGTIAGVAPPTDALGALVGWVERGRAPDVLEAATLPGAEPGFTRRLCRFPLVAEWDGRGDAGLGESWRCVREC